MRTTRLRAFWNFEKEEKWLNNMAAQGYHLVDYFWIRYVFEIGDRNAYKYRVIFLEKKAGDPKSLEYLQFLEENGFECIATYMHWAFLRCATDADFEVYSDKQDIIRHLTRIARFWLSAGLLELVLAVIELASAVVLVAKYSSLNIVYFICGLLLLAVASGFLGMHFKLRKQIRKIRKESLISE